MSNLLWKSSDTEIAHIPGQSALVLQISKFFFPLGLA